MKHKIILLAFFFISSESLALQSKNTDIRFDQALPEDISNDNFPDRIDSFDFPSASLLDLVKAIGKLTGINFIVDPGLANRKISIIAPSPITVAEAYKAFLSALSANDYTVVKSGRFWKIQSLNKAHKDNIEVYSGDYFPNTDQLITRIIKLKYINASDFMASIKWLLSQENKISTHESTNSIILSDFGSVIERIMKIVYEMDVPGSEEGIAILPIEHASAEELAVILRELLSLGGSSRRNRSSLSRSRGKKVPTLSPRFNNKKEGSMGNEKISNILPDMRTNSLIVSANKAGLKRVKALIKKLDTRVDASRTGGVYVYNVLYGTAEEVYNTLMGIKAPDKNTSSSKNNRFRSSFSPPTNRRSNRQSSAESPLFENVTILADSNTNSLIISAKNKYEYERVLDVLKKIDVPRDQVFIQAIILEMIVGRNNNSEFNLPLAVKSLFDTLPNKIKDKAFFKNIGESALAGFLSNSFNLESLQRGTQLGPGFVLGLPLLKFLGDSLNIDSLSNRNLPPGYDALDSDGQRDVLKAIGSQIVNDPLRRALSSSLVPMVRLLKTADNVNILSTPQITTLDNVQAFIEVGSNIEVGSSSTLAPGGLSQNSPDRQDVTLKLEITPRINPESGTIQMDIKQKFDDFTTTAGTTDRNGINILKRNIETKMVLHDGETAVLGGLLDDRNVVNTKKVPLLGDIPVLGWFFKGSETVSEKRNLLVFIMPTIIRGEEQKAKHKEILGRKLEERIEFIEKYMSGKDPHEKLLNKMIPGASSISYRHKEKELVEDDDDNGFFGKIKEQKTAVEEFVGEVFTGESKEQETVIEGLDSEEDSSVMEELDSEEDSSTEILENLEEDKFVPEDFKSALPKKEETESGYQPLSAEPPSFLLPVEDKANNFDSNSEDLTNQEFTSANEEEDGEEEEEDEEEDEEDDDEDGEDDDSEDFEEEGLLSEEEDFLDEESQ